MRWKKFDLQFRSSSATTAKVSETRPKIVGRNKNVSSTERTIHIKDARIENQGNQNVPTAMGHMLHLYKGCPEYKKTTTKNRHSGNMLPITKKHMPQLSAKTLSHSKTTNETFTYTAEQLTTFVANVVIQMAQPLVCYLNPKQDTLDLKSSICRKVSNAAKTILNIDITGRDLFESIGPLSAPASPAPFKFTSTKINPIPKTILKASTVLKSITPHSKSSKAAPKQSKTSK